MAAVRDTKSAEIRSRIEPDLKEKSAEVLAHLGLDLSGAIRLFLRQVVEVHGLPFEVRRPNPVTVAAMRDARKSISPVDDVSDGLEKGNTRATAGRKNRSAFPKVGLKKRAPKASLRRG